MTHTIAGSAAGAPPERQPGHALPPRDQAQFRTMVKLFDDKNFKRSLKIADAVLKKHPENGETLSMKALILLSTSTVSNPKEKAAMELAKRGLRFDLRSSLCWHALGLLYRSSTDCKEAMRCFRQAWKLDPDNLSLGRDLSSLQIQQRATGSFLETRRHICFVQPKLKEYWTSYAFAHHLCGNFDIALKILRAVSQGFRPATDITNGDNACADERWAQSELLLYEAMIMEEAGWVPQAIDFLQSQCDGVADTFGHGEALGRLLIWARRFDEAHAVFRKMYTLQRSNRQYLLCYLATSTTYRGRTIFPDAPEFPRHSVAVATTAVVQGGSTARGKPPLARGDPIGTGNPDSRSCSRTAPDITHAPYGGGDSKRPTNEGPPFMELSPSALGGPLLRSISSVGWPTPPTHLLFKHRSGTGADCLENCSPFVATGSASQRPRDMLLHKVRSLSMDEEVELSLWFLENVIVVNDKNANDTALRLLLDFLSNSQERFIYFLDKLLRPKLLKGAFYFLSVMETLLSPRSLKGEWIKILIERYMKELENPHATGLGGAILELPPEILLPGTADDCSSGEVQGGGPKTTEQLPENVECDRCRENEATRFSPSTVAAWKTICHAGLAYIYCRWNLWESALEELDAAVEITPTAPELFQLKAEVLRAMGCMKAAVAAMAYAREMDLADRFLNSSMIDYLLAAGDTTTAAKLSTFFSRDSETDNAITAQNMTFNLQMADAFRRNGDQVSALEQYRHPVKHIQGMKLDLHDLHWYTMRRGTYRAYLQLLRTMDRFFGQWFYRYAAQQCITIYLDNHCNRNVAGKLSSSTQPTHRTHSKVEKLSSPAEGGAATVKSGVGKLKSDADDKEADASPLRAAEGLTSNLRTGCAQFWDTTYDLLYRLAFVKNRPLTMLHSVYRRWQLTGKNSLHSGVTVLLLHFLRHVVSVLESRQNPTPTILVSTSDVPGAADSSAKRTDSVNSITKAQPAQPTSDRTSGQLEQVARPAIWTVLVELAQHDFTDPSVSNTTSALESLRIAVARTMTDKDEHVLFESRVAAYAEAYLNCIMAQRWEELCVVSLANVLDCFSVAGSPPDAFLWLQKYVERLSASPRLRSESHANFELLIEKAAALSPEAEHCVKDLALSVFPKSDVFNVAAN